ncbi:MAG: MetQ/NlpA family ABC transporter substrate-binding protein [Bacillota bacterium]|nr:MetQ/NlpA family ABC transporter substrate-binding protein [Bacillota bacterium]
MKRVFICFLIALVSLGAVGCGQEADTPDTTKIVNIGVMPDVESIPFIIAEKNGYFEEQGVQVNIEHFKSASDRDSALQSGQLDGVVSDVLAIVFANEGGFDLRMISKTDGNIDLLAGKDSGIESVKDLTDKSVGMSLNTVMEYTVDQMLLASKISAEDADNVKNIEKMAIPKLPTRLEMLQNDKIDAAILPEPLAGLAVGNGARVLTSTDELGEKAIVIAFIDKSLQENPEEIKAVFRAYNDAVAYLAKAPLADYVDYIIEEQGFPEGMKNSINLPQYNNATLPSEEMFNHVVQWMQGKQLIENDYEYNDLINDQVLR